MTATNAENAVIIVIKFTVNCRMDVDTKHWSKREERKKRHTAWMCVCTRNKEEKCVAMIEKESNGRVTMAQ